MPKNQARSPITEQEIAFALLVLSAHDEDGPGVLDPEAVPGTAAGAALDPSPNADPTSNSSNLTVANRFSPSETTLSVPRVPGAILFRTAGPPSSQERYLGPDAVELRIADGTPSFVHEQPKSMEFYRILQKPRAQVREYARDALLFRPVQTFSAACLAPEG